MLLRSLLQTPPHLLRACCGPPFTLCSELDVLPIFLSVYHFYAGKLWGFEPVSLLCEHLAFMNTLTHFFLNNYFS